MILPRDQELRRLPLFRSKDRPLKRSNSAPTWARSTIRVQEATQPESSVALPGSWFDDSGRSAGVRSWAHSGSQDRRTTIATERETHVASGVSILRIA